jgi:hypothetical protein
MRALGVRDSETAKAVGLAAATMGANLAAVGFTVVFARVLGADGYGSLAALLNLTIILMVPGSALQIARRGRAPWAVSASGESSRAPWTAGRSACSWSSPVSPPSRSSCASPLPRF